MLMNFNYIYLIFWASFAICIQLNLVNAQPRVGVYAFLASGEEANNGLAQTIKFEFEKALSNSEHLNVVPRGDLATIHDIHENENILKEGYQSPEPVLEAFPGKELDFAIYGRVNLVSGEYNISAIIYSVKTGIKRASDIRIRKGLITDLQAIQESMHQLARYVEVTVAKEYSPITPVKEGGDGEVKEDSDTLQTITTPDTTEMEPARMLTPMRGGYRSFVPGLAQIHKKEKGKGWLFIGAETALLTSSLVLGYYSSEFDADARVAQNQADRTHFLNKSANYRQGSVLMLVGAGIIYIVNVIDGFLPDMVEMDMDHAGVNGHHFSASSSRNQIQLSIKYTF